MLEIVHQLLRHRLLVSLIRQGRAVAGIQPHSDFVLYLDHDHGVLPAIHILHMPHQGRESASVRVTVCVAQGRQQFQGLARLNLRARKTFEILLHPVGRVTREAVLPAGEPQERKMQIVLARAANNPVQHGEIELPFLGFDLRPGNRRKHSVQLGLNEFRPYRLHVIETAGTIVVQFPGQDEKRLAVDNELRGRSLLAQVGNFRGDGDGRRRDGFRRPTRSRLAE
jgi:hypothetical protein